MEEILNQVSQAWLKTNAVHYSSTYWIMRLNWRGFWTKLGVGSENKRRAFGLKMFEITGDAGAPLCASLDIMLRLLDTLPSFPANLSYQSNSPIICSFVPEAYAQPWLGLHGVDLACLPSFESHKKATDILKEAIIQSTGGGAVSRVRAGPSASTSTSTEPTQIEKDADAPLLTSSSAVCSPSKCRCTKSPSPQCSQSDSSSDEEMCARALSLEQIPWKTFICKQDKSKCDCLQSVHLHTHWLGKLVPHLQVHPFLTNMFDI